MLGLHLEIEGEMLPLMTMVVRGGRDDGEGGKDVEDDTENGVHVDVVVVVLHDEEGGKDNGVVVCWR